MYANALKRVFDEDDDTFKSHPSNNNMPMEIKKIDDYDGRVKKFYNTNSSAETPKSTNKNTSIVAMEDSGSMMGGGSINTSNEHFYPSSSTQKSSYKTLKISPN